MTSATPSTWRTATRPRLKRTVSQAARLMDGRTDGQLDCGILPLARPCSTSSGSRCTISHYPSIFLSSCLPNPRCQLIRQAVLSRFRTTTPAASSNLKRGDGLEKANRIQRRCQLSTTACGWCSIAATTCSPSDTTSNLGLASIHHYRVRCHLLPEPSQI